jgi:uroporphyrinogen III methyltransferase/synthase
MRNETLRKMVYLVGAGPGDPGLITVKGRTCIEIADVIIYDYLAASSLLKHARKSVELIYVGKKGGDHTLSQDGINDLLVQKAYENKIVTRLKGGDPFIFGRGGEEVEVLMAHAIPFEIVPGVTSAIAAPAYAGIPLTHRKHTATVAFVTGHEDPNKKESNIDWAALAKGIGTLVFFMGIKNLANIVSQLISHGKPGHTPVAIIRWGTTSQQHTVSGTLDTIIAIAQKNAIKPPALIVVGSVVDLRQHMQWFENRPLWSKRIVVTRAREQASDLINRLETLGANCLECPTIKTAPPDDWGPLDTAISTLNHYDWLIFTSVNGVTFFFERLFKKGLDVRALGQIRIATIGPVTSKKLQDYGLRSDIVPKTYRAESILEAFADQPIKNCKILLPRAKKARSVLPKELTRQGAQVNEVTAYQTLAVAEQSEDLIKALSQREIDLVTFTSSSTAINFRQLLPDDQFQDLMHTVQVASIGPITSETAIKLGFQISIEAQDFTIEGLCQAILRHYRVQDN